MHDTTLYWIWLSELAGLSLKKKRTLLAALGNPEQIFRASATTVDDVLHGSGSSSSVAEGAKGFSLESSWKARNLEIAETILANNEKSSIMVLDATSPYYRHIYEADEKAPLVLYYRGRLCDPSIPVVGVVGSRACTSYGRLVTKAAVSDLVGEGSIVASGLSFGIDALAHETTLACGGITYAFLPCGLHKAQPASHADLMERIADTGAVITPYAYGREALRFRFIGRNDLLASWCNTLLVIEAGMKSGSMHTARSALSKAKQVLAVPNSLLEPKSSGTNLLLSEGAHAYLNDRLVVNDSFVQTCSGEEVVAKALASRPLSTTELEAWVQIGDGPVMECLASMELAGKVSFLSDGKWHLVGGL
ncbi:DNA processing protein [Sphaerochaeta associata]|uniref:DNA-protecting protein DprA n=1 Tax=Sphaerochaeta associata TaxID=1129264 RepID=A0ABY4DB98_9SPIR|nr:DNA-processing protein DprA [Sphaerochaeta associata]UOM51470.1 DNA-protecting protein DprA [Sphaerochaeta associata]SMP61555.1 DNA processing protein [Sphaerochaeta associata]